MMSVSELRKDEMMQHLMGAMEEGKDIGHYGRLVFCMVAQHFLKPEEMVEWLCKDKSCKEDEARAMVMSVMGKGYSPPTREKIREFQKRQEFPICPSDDPDACNVYRNLKFPEGVYEHIQEYQVEKARARVDEGEGVHGHRR